MSRVSTCPQVGELQRFLLGRSSEQETGELEQHLEACDHCFRTLQTLPAEDALVQALRTPVHDDALARQEAVHRLIARLKGRRATRGASAGDETVAPDASSRPLSHGDTLSGAPVPRATFAQGSPSPSRADTPRRAPLPEAAVAPSSEDHTEETYDFLAPAERPDEIGRLGPYRVLKVLGAGGMGVVFKAEDPHLERLVALKAMLPALVSGAGAKQRFLREARAAASLKHDHVVTIHQVGEDRGVPYLAMEFLEGESLEERLKREGTLPLKEVLRIGREMAEGLAAAHKRGLIHRDIKPANIWLEGDRARVKVLDFGLARAVADTAHLTQPGAIVGTPAYMAPEQTRAEGVDHRADLFSLGCVLYRMATGEMAFKGTNTLSILASVGLDTPKPPREVNPAVPAVLSDLIVRLLAKKPADRPPTAVGVAEVLETLQRELPGTPKGVRRPSRPAAEDRTMVTPAPTAVVAPPRRRNRLWLAAAVLGGVAAILAAGVVIYVQTDKGTLKIETTDNDVQVIVEQGGKQVKVIDTKTGKEVSLASGEYTLRLGEDRKDVVLAPDHITLTRGGTAVAVITRTDVPPADVAKPGKPPDTPAAAPLDEAWIKSVAALPAEKQVEEVVAKLKERNPGFDGKVTSALHDGLVVGEMKFCTDKVTDVSPLRALRGLERLDCTGSQRDLGQLADLTPLKGLPLTFLSCASNRITDLSPLKDMPLQCIWFPLNKVADLSPLKGLPLTNVNCALNPVSDLSPLEGMSLQWLTCYETKVSDLTPLKGMPLTCLIVGGSPVSDLSPLQGMPLTYLDCHSTKVVDLSPLKAMPLKEVNCDFQPERDAEILRSIKTLEKINGKPAAEFWKGVDVRQAPIEEAWFKVVAAMKAEEQVQAVAAKLKERNLGFDGAVGHSKIENGVVTEFTFRTDEVTDVSPVRALAGLTSLRCDGSEPGKGKLADLSPLKDMRLTDLSCQYTQVSDLSPLKGMELTYLVCGDTKVSDLSPLKGMGLTRLSCASTQVSDLSPLKGMNLTYLVCGDTKVSDLSPLKGMGLTYLDCNYTPVSDLSLLKGMPLTTLHFHGTKVADLSSLKGMGLTELDFDITQVSDLSPLKGMRLTSLECNRTPVADLSPLAGMPLTGLDCNSTKVSDLSPLKGMGLTSLSCNSTNVADLSPLKGMELTYLMCYSTQVADLSPLKGMPLKELWCDFKPERDAEILRSIKTLEKINDKPAAEFWKEFKGPPAPKP